MMEIVPTSTDEPLSSQEPVMTITMTTPTATSTLARRGAGPLLGAATVAMGLIAGFFYAYACSVMIGLARVDDHTFVATMQSINATVRNAGFAPSFFGALLLTGAAAAAQARTGRRRPAVVWILAALALYVAAFGVTMGVSVPLNDELARAGDPDRISDLADLAAVRDRYEAPWVTWNIVRTVASTAALACLSRALVLHRRSGR
jgi:uncharacterized membrane protein